MKHDLTADLDGLLFTCCRLEIREVLATLANINEIDGGDARHDVRDTTILDRDASVGLYDRHLGCIHAVDPEKEVDRENHNGGDETSATNERRRGKVVRRSPSVATHG